MGKPTIIELNGKKYDATTGALLGQSLIKAAPTSREGLQRHGRVIDGFIRSTKQSHAHAIPAKQHLQTTAKTTSHATTASHPKKQPDVKRPAKNVIQAHQPERPKTLMRQVVKKPRVQMKPAIKTAAPTEMAARPTSTIAKPLEKKMSVTQVNPVRLARAKHIARSHHIHKFERQRATPVQAAIPVTAHTSTGARSLQQAARPVRQDFHVPAGRSAIVQSQVSQTQVAQQQSQPDIFEAALAHATSHEQKTPPHTRHFTARRKRFVNVMAGIGAFLLIGGFATYMNMTNIEMRVASMKAGFSVQMPSYKPTGYALEGRVENNDGTVTMRFRSGDSAYTITQQASEWNSATLLDQAAAEQGQPKQTIASKGRTVYIYNGSNATWVNGGVRYQVTGNAALDADELVALATSM